MKRLLGIFYALVPALLMSVPIAIFDIYFGLLIFIGMFGLGLSVLFGNDEEWRKL